MDIFDHINFESPAYHPHIAAEKIVRAIAPDLPEYYSGDLAIVTQQELIKVVELMLIYKQEAQQ